jgi:carbonic anhydrase/acetyltransferase-like protein (isoleucine patch superfamily)
MMSDLITRTNLLLEKVGKKYDFTGKVKTIHNREVKQIIRLSDELIGGWIESEDNLSQLGTCFVYDEAMVWGNGEVSENARILGKAQVYGRASAYGAVQISGDAEIYGEAKVFGSAEVLDLANIYGSSSVYGASIVSGNALVSGDAVVFGKATITDHAVINGKAQVFGRAVISGTSTVSGKATVSGDAEVSGKSTVEGDAIIAGTTKLVDELAATGEHLGASPVVDTDSIHRQLKILQNNSHLDNDFVEKATKVLDKVDLGKDLSGKDRAVLSHTVKKLAHLLTKNHVLDALNGKKEAK